MRPERFHRLRSVLDRRQPDLTVVMDRVNKGHNLSAVLRNCDAVGVLEVHAVLPEGGLTLHHDTSAGTAKWMRVHEHPDLVQALERVRSDGLQVVAAHAGPQAIDYRDVDYTLPTAILMGAELFGVSPEGLDAADVTAALPMVGMARSLNVSVATALFLYEAYRQRAAEGMYDTSRMDPERYRSILFEWAYPEFARRYRDAGVPYPELDPDGSIRD